jgi:hypothetical protein
VFPELLFHKAGNKSPEKNRMTIAQKESAQNERLVETLLHLKALIDETLDRGCYMIMAAGLDPEPGDRDKDGHIAASPMLRRLVAQRALGAAAWMTAASVSNKDFKTMAGEAHSEALGTRGH